MSNNFVNASDSKPKVYGKWTINREHTAIQASIDYHPFSLKKNEKKEAKENICNAVNSTDPKEPKLGRTAIDKRIENLIQEVSDKQKNDLTYGTGSNDSETTLENLVLTLISMIKDHEQSKAENDGTASKAMAEKRRGQARVVGKSMQGLRKSKYMDRATPSNQLPLNLANNKNIPHIDESAKEKEENDTNDEECMDGNDVVEPCLKRQRFSTFDPTRTEDDCRLLSSLVEEERLYQKKIMSSLLASATTIEKFTVQLQPILTEHRKINEQFSQMLQAQTALMTQMTQMTSNTALTAPVVKPSQKLPLPKNTNRRKNK